MKNYCPKCLMTVNHPNLKFHEDGVCYACHNFDGRKEVNWEDRKKQFYAICDKYRKNDGSHDVLIGVSGGKDSHTIVHYAKDAGMTPLLVTVSDAFSHTEAGKHNLDNIKKTFNCDSIVFEPAKATAIKIARIGFEKFCAPLIYCEDLIYIHTIKTAMKEGIKLVLFGENSEYEFGWSNKETPYANDYVQRALMGMRNSDFWKKEFGLTDSEIYPLSKPKGQLPDVLFMSYFFPWSSVGNYEIAKRFGFHNLLGEWERTGTPENFEQIDSYAYLSYLWMKFPKFGYQRASDIVSRRVRDGLMSIEEGKKIILERDPELDPFAFRDFCNVCGYTEKEAWEVIDRFYNRKLFVKDRFGRWVLKDGRFNDNI